MEQEVKNTPVQESAAEPAAPREPVPQTPVQPTGQDKVLSRLKSRFGIEKDDWDAVLSAMEAREEEVKQAFDKQQARQRAQRERRTMGILAEWRRQGEELARLYPEFSFREAGRDARFRVMMKSGCTVQQAYEALHPQALQERMRKEGRRQAELAISRPKEAGAHTGAPIRSRTSLARLNRSQREEVARRVLKGERIEG